MQVAKKGLNRLSAQLFRLETQDGGARAIQLTDETFQIRAHQPVAHAFEDVLGLGSQVGHLPVLVPEFFSDFSKAFRQMAGEVGDREETEKARPNLDLQGSQVYRKRGGGHEIAKGRIMGCQIRNYAWEIRQFQQSPHANETYRRHQENPPARKKDAGKDDHHQVKREVIAFQVSREVQYGGYDSDVRENLQISLQKVIPA